MGHLPRKLRELSKRRVLVALLLAGVLAAGCARRADRAVVSDGRYAMGTVLEATLVVDDEVAGRALLARCFDGVSELDRLLTSWDATSEVSRLNRAAGQGPLPVDGRVVRLLRESIALSRATDGAFDVTVGPLVELWTAAARRDRAPSDAERAAALARVGSGRIEIDGLRVALADPGMRVNLGAVAKGWALDRMRECLRAGGVDHALLSFGQSSLLAMGRPADAPVWTVGLRGWPQPLLGYLDLDERALSVSGSLGQWSEIGGVRYGHVIDPRSGRALRRSLQAAVVGRTATEVEAWSTALTVLGEPGLAAVEAVPDLDALLLDEEGETRATSGWEAAVGFQPLP